MKENYWAVLLVVLFIMLYKVVQTFVDEPKYVTIQMKAIYFIFFSQ